jgi:N-sulfoglucosamine sulfohydrolase
MRFWLSLAITLALALPATAANPRNVVLLVADDLGLQLGCYGDLVVKTPNLDALAKSGTRFTHAFASVASCSASRGTILTGLPTHTCGQYGHAHAEHNIHSFRTVQGLPALLAPAGYKSGVIAKLHVQPKEVYPFDVEVPGNGRNPVQIANQAKKFVAECGDTPFFLLVGFTDPHRAAKGFANDGKYPDDVPAVKYDPKAVPVPYHLPDQPEVRAELAEMYQSISRLDDGVGRVLKVLDEAKKLDDTLVIFLSDNGIPFPGAKTTLYDAGIRLPLVVRKPGQKSGVVNSAMVSWTDVTPTILDWCGVKPPAPANKKAVVLPGKSFLPILEDAKPEGWDVVFASHQFHEVTMYYPMRVVRTREFKYILNIAHPLEAPHASDLWASPTWQGILKRGDRLMGSRGVKTFLHRPKEELYDVGADPNELKNLADPAHAKTLDELRKKLTAWREKTNDPWLVKNTHE